MTSVITDPVRSRPEPAARPGWTTPLVAALVLGGALGTLTLFGQSVLTGSSAALANAAAPWLVVPFAVGAISATRVQAVVAGMLASVVQVIAFYAVSPVQDYVPAHTEIWFWAVCGVIGGPVLGWGGHVWWRGTGRARARGAGLLPATFAAEALGSYVWTLHYVGQAVLFGVISALLLALTVALIGRRRPVAAAFGWFAVFTAAGFVVFAFLLQGGAHAAFH